MTDLQREKIADLLIKNDKDLLNLLKQYYAVTLPGDLNSIWKVEILKDNCYKIFYKRIFTLQIPRSYRYCTMESQLQELLCNKF